MGQGCTVDHAPNGGNVERSMESMEKRAADQKSPVFIGMQGNAYGGGQNSAPQSHCPPMPPTVPTPPCGGRTNNCSAKGEAQRLADRPEQVTCNVTEYELTCKWEPRVVPKTCTVMVPQYKAVCAQPKKIQAVVQRKYDVDAKFDADRNGRIDDAEFRAAQAAGGLTPISDPTIVGGNMGGGAALGGGAAAFGGGNVGGGMSGGAMQMGGGPMQMGGGAMQMGGGGMQMGGGMGQMVGGMGGGMGGGYGGGGGY